MNTITEQLAEALRAIAKTAQEAIDMSERGPVDFAHELDCVGDNARSALAAYEASKATPPPSR